MAKLLYTVFFVKVGVGAVHCTSFFLSLLPLQAVRFLAKRLGLLAYYINERRRKLAIENVRRAMPYLSATERKKIAKASFQNSAIVALEMFALFKNRDHFKHITFHQAEPVFAHLNSGKGVIFLTSHQANWEVIFPSLNRYYRGMGIGKPLRKSPRMYQLVLSFRQMHGGRSVVPKNAIHESLRSLRGGEHVLFVDHAYRRRSKFAYSYPLFGNLASTSPVPAFLAYRTNNPIVVLTNQRTEKGYEISFSPMLFPNRQNPFREEIPKLMDRALHIMERSIAERPGDWMWTHNRWKIDKKSL